MDRKIAIPDEDVLELDQIAPDVYGLSILIVNAALRPSAVAAGHGRPLSGADIADSLEKLASDFDTVARPQHGRYVDRPAA